MLKKIFLAAFMLMVAGYFIQSATSPSPEQEEIIATQQFADEAIALAANNDSMALDRLNHALTLPITNKSRAQIYVALGSYTLRTGSGRTALEYFQAALAMPELPDTERVGALIVIGHCYYAGKRDLKQNLQAALEYYHAAIATEKLSDDLRAEILCLIAKIYDDNDDSLKASKYYQKVLNIDESSNDVRAVALSNLALLYHIGAQGIMKDSRTALKYYQEALAIPGLPGEVRARTLCGIGAIYLESKEDFAIETALQYFQKALDTPESSNMVRAIVLANMGEIYWSKNSVRNYQKSLECSKAALAIPEIPIPHRAKALVGIGFIHYTNKKSIADHKIALECFQEALTLGADPSIAPSLEIFIKNIQRELRDQT